MSWILGILIVLLYILHVYFFLYLKKLNVLDSWHINCFIVHSAYLLFYCTSDFYVFFFFFFHFLFVELMSDAALISKLDMSTPTPIKVDD